jgi:hypothetical protein
MQLMGQSLVPRIVHRIFIASFAVLSGTTYRGTAFYVIANIKEKYA